MTETIAIVGASLAGARAAQTVRQTGFAGRLLLIGEETWAPYERPPLSKDALLTDGQPQWVCSLESLKSSAIEFLPGRRVVSLHRTADAFSLAFGDRTSLVASKVLLTTGGRPRCLSAAEGVRGVHYLRTWDDAQRLKAALLPGVRVAVIGSGFIGAEVAATAVAAGCSVQVLEAAPRIFGAIQSPIILDCLRDAHEAAGVRFRTTVGIAKISNTSAGNVALLLQDGEQVNVDVVVIGIGMIPNVELAVAAGARLEAGGVAVDATYQSSVPGLYAAGDVATREVHGAKRRIEHWRNAQEQGVGAAMGMTGQTVAALPAAWCWSDQHGHRLEIAGEPGTNHTRVERRISDREHVTFHLEGNRFAGVTALNAPRVVRDALSKLGRAWHPNVEQLADPARPLSKVDAETQK